MSNAYFGARYGDAVAGGLIVTVVVSALGW